MHNCSKILFLAVNLHRSTHVQFITIVLQLFECTWMLLFQIVSCFLIVGV